MAFMNSCLSLILSCIPLERRSRYLYLSLRSSFAAFSLSIMNGSVAHLERMDILWALTSISPVGMSWFIMLSGLSLTMPVTAMQYSILSSEATF